MNDLLGLIRNSHFSDLLLAFKWLVCYYLNKTHQRVKDLKSSGMSDFDAKNNSQTFLARTLSLVYAEVRTICICLLHYIQLLIGAEEMTTCVLNSLHQIGRV